MKIISEGERFEFDGDHQAFADWMLSIVDSSPDKLAVFPMPVRTANSDEDGVEGVVRTAYHLAKADRPDLGVKILHALDTRNDVPKSRVLVVIHEHSWVGGRCVNGCPDTRKVG